MVFGCCVLCGKRGTECGFAFAPGPRCLLFVRIACSRKGGRLRGPQRLPPGRPAPLRSLMLGRFLPATAGRSTFVAASDGPCSPREPRQICTTGALNDPCPVRGLHHHITILYKTTLFFLSMYFECRKTIPLSFLRRLGITDRGKSFFAKNPKLSLSFVLVCIQVSKKVKSFRSKELLGIVS